MKREDAVKWCNSRLTKVNQYDMDDIVFTRDFLNKVHDKLFDINVVVGSFQRSHALQQLEGCMQNMFMKVLDEFKINEVENIDNQIIKFF